MREHRSADPSSFSSGFLRVFLFSFLLFSLGTAGVEIVRLDVRFAIFIQDMTRYALSVFPTINGEPYPDYPVTMILFAWLFSAAGRFVNQWTLSLFSILCGSLTVALTWLTGERIKRGTGVIAASLLFMTLEFNTTIMSFGIDVPVMAAGALILYCLTVRAGIWKSGVFFFLLLVFAFLIRGPMGLFLAGAAAGGWLLFARQWKQTVIWGMIGAAASLICLGGGYYLIHAAGGQELYKEFFSWQISSRMAADDLFFYLFDGPVVFSPSTAFGIAVLLTVLWKRPRGAGIVLPLFGFLLLPLVLLSIPGCKHLRYMMITVPAFALIGAWGVRKSFVFPRCRRILRAVFRFLAQYAWIAALCIGLSVTIVMAAMAGILDLRLARCGLLILFPAAGLVFRKKTGLIRDILRTGIVLGILGCVFIFPASTFRELSEDFVRTAEQYRTGRLYFYRIGVDHEDLKYLQFLTPEERADAVYLTPSPDPDDKYRKMYRRREIERLADMNPGDLLVIKSKDAGKLEEDAANCGRKVLFRARGNLGHKEYQVVELRKDDAVRTKLAEPGSPAGREEK